MNQIELLIEILFDPKASSFERDDAAMDLSQYDDSRAISALEKYAENPIEDEVLDICGEAISKSWINENKFYPDIFVKFVPKVQRIIFSYIKQYYPHWIKEYPELANFKSSPTFKKKKL